MNVKIFSIAAILAATIFFASCNRKTEVVYDVPFEQIEARAKQENRDFYVVLSRPDCQSCSEYVNRLTPRIGKRLFRDGIVNVVDVSLPEHQWLAHWLCVGAFPTTCVFSSEGELKAVVSGASGMSMQCLNAVTDGDTKCADYFYQRHYPVKGDYISVLNDILDSRRGIERGEDMGQALEDVLQRADYPYPVYLKAVNERKQQRHEDAVHWGGRVLAFDDTYYYYVYDDMYRETKYIVNPDYTPKDDAMLMMVEEVALGDCRVGEPQSVRIDVTNEGKYPAFISDITVSCTCLELLSPKQHRLEPGDTVGVELEFTAENPGNIYREVTFFSNATERIKRVALRATAI